MYFGAVGEGAVERIILELLSNSVDQFLAGEATEVRLRLDSGMIEVSDDGAGFPLEGAADGSVSGVIYLKRHHNSRTADGHAPHIHLSWGGAGLAPVNAASEWFRVRSWRSGRLWELEFRRGILVSGPHAIREGVGRGTEIALIPDVEILGATAARRGAVRARMFEAVHLFPGLIARLDDERFHAPDGLVDLAYLDAREAWNRDRSQSDFAASVRLEDILVTVAALGRNSDGSVWRTWVNGSRTPLHGSHRLGFEDALRRVQWKPASIALHAVMYDAHYAGPTKDCLEVPHAREVISNGCFPLLEKYCRENQLGIYRPL